LKPGLSKIVHKTLSWNTLHSHKKGLVEWLKVLALSSNPSVTKKNYHLGKSRLHILYHLFYFNYPLHNNFTTKQMMNVFLCHLKETLFFIINRFFFHFISIYQLSQGVSLWYFHTCMQWTPMQFIVSITLPHSVSPLL
jgi:hypothetical protein